MATARTLILRRLRAAQAQLPHADPVASVAPLTATLDECAARFSIEAAALGVDCFIAATDDDVKRRVDELTGNLRVMSWSREHLPYGLGDVLKDPILGVSSREQQAAAEIGVTGCDAAIAETGSLVLFSGPGRSRAVSLLPPVHLAIVDRAKLCFTMADVFAKHRTRLEQSAACTVITGPSRTADIELTLTLGIHGPGRVVVIIGP